MERKIFGTNHYSRNLIFLTMKNLFPYSKAEILLTLYIFIRHDEKKYLPVYAMKGFKQYQLRKKRL